jgi:hypothetical protein
LSADYIPRCGQSTHGAFVPAVPQGLWHRGAAEAGLAGWARVHPHQLATGAFCLVAEFGEEAVPTRILHRAGQPAAGQAFNVQILHGNFAVPLHQPAADVVVERGALIPDLAVCFGNLKRGLCGGGCSPLPPGEFALLKYSRARAGGRYD